MALNNDAFDFSLQDIRLRRLEDGTYSFSLKICPSSSYSVENNKYNLTPREKEILSKVILGLSNIEIAKELIVSVSTVKAHISNILSKLNVKDRVQAVAKSISENIIDI